MLGPSAMSANLYALLQRVHGGQAVLGRQLAGELERSAHHLLAAAALIDTGGVQEVDVGIEGAVEQPDRVGLIRWPAEQQA
jgi:hypothetical protein